MTKPPASSNLARLDFCGPPPLLEGEDVAAYNELLARISGTVKPADVIEESWVREVVDLTWEIFRWRRVKANLITASTYAGVEVVLSPMLGNVVAHSFAEDWARGDADAIIEVNKRLASAGLTMDAVMAQTLVAVLDEIERFDRLTMNAEARRSMILREVERHRQSLGQALRRASDEVVDAQFEQIEAPKIEDRKAA